MASETPSRASAEAAALPHAGAESDRGAADRLLPLLYDQLRKAAQRQMNGERAGHTLSATALVHEAYLKLLGPRELPWAGRGQFYVAATEAMRWILLDHAKARARVKRGGGIGAVVMDAGATLGAASEEAVDSVALDAAICRLEGRDPRAAEVVRLRFYAGLTIEETALALGVSERTVKNDWAFSRAWLARELST